MSLSDYQGAYALHSSLDVGATTHLGQLRGSYTTLDDGESYDLTAPAEIERLEIVPEPDLDLDGWPGYRIHVEATVEDFGIRIESDANSWLDTAATDYFGALTYQAEGSIKIFALGDTLYLETGIHYNEPGELVGEGSINTWVEPTSGD